MRVGPKMVNSKKQLDFQRRGASNEVTSRSKLSIVLKACFRCGQRDLSRLVFDSGPAPSDPLVAGGSTVQARPLWKATWHQQYFLWLLFTRHHQLHWWAPTPLPKAHCSFILFIVPSPKIHRVRTEWSPMPSSSIGRLSALVLCFKFQIPQFKDYHIFPHPHVSYLPSPNVVPPIPIV